MTRSRLTTKINTDYELSHHIIEEQQRLHTWRYV